MRSPTAISDRLSGIGALASREWHSSPHPGRPAPSRLRVVNPCIARIVPLVDRLSVVATLREAQLVQVPLHDHTVVTAIDEVTDASEEAGPAVRR